MFDELLTLSPDAILILDDRGQMLRANTAAERLFGYGPGELAGRAVEILLPERFREMHVQNRVTYSAEPHRRSMGSGLELWGKRKDGSEFAVDIMLGPVKTDDEAFVLAIARDISDRKLAERVIQESEERYRVVAESATDAIITIDPESKIHFANPATERIFGYTIEEMVGQQLTMLMPEPLRHVHENAVHRYLDTGRKRIEWNAVELPGLHKSGKEISLEVSFGELTSNGKRFFTGVARDITERKEAQRLLKDSHGQLRRLAAHLQSVREEERTRIAREVHDELGQVLTGLKLDLFQLKNKLPGAEAQERIESSLELVDVTIGTVQRIAKDLRPSVLDDLGLRKAIEWQVKEFCGRTEIECEMDLGSEEIVLRRELSTAIFRIFQEVLTNVARHAGATRIQVSLVEDDADIILEVEDNGRGIADNEICDPESLGLLGMRERAHVLGGETRVRRAEDGGTVVSMRIPLGDLASPSN